MKKCLFGIAAYIILFAHIAFLVSCNSYKKIPYFMNLKDTTQIAIATASYASPIVQPDDILNITIQTIDGTASAILNQNNALSPAVGSSSANPIGQQTTTGYLVDKDGNIEFPIIGKINLLGMTTAKVRDVIRNKLSIYYKTPTVDVRFSNFKITVLGEVNRPATYTIPNEKVTILDALGLAGDLTIFGKRENVLLIRDSLGYKTLTRINLNDSRILTSRYFFLQQNDVLYIEPNKSKIANLDASRSRDITIITSALSVLIVLLSRIK